MASERQIKIGSVPVGGGAPVAVQTMTKTETANLAATMAQIRTVADVIELAKRRGTPLRVGVHSGSLPKHLRQLEYDNPVEALVTAAIETVELMERLDFRNFKVSMKSTSVPNTVASNRMLSQRIPYPLHLGVTEAGTKWSGSLKSAVGLGTLLADGIG